MNATDTLKDAPEALKKLFDKNSDGTYRNPVVIGKAPMGAGKTTSIEYLATREPDSIKIIITDTIEPSQFQDFELRISGIRSDGANNFYDDSEKFPTLQEILSGEVVEPTVLQVLQAFLMELDRRLGLVQKPEDYQALKPLILCVDEGNTMPSVLNNLPSEVGVEKNFWNKVFDGINSKTRRAKCRVYYFAHSTTAKKTGNVGSKDLFDSYPHLELFSFPPKEFAAQYPTFDAATQRFATLRLTAKTPPHAGFIFPKYEYKLTQNVPNSTERQSGLDWGGESEKWGGSDSNWGGRVEERLRSGAEGSLRWGGTSLSWGGAYRRIAETLDTTGWLVAQQVKGTSGERDFKTFMKWVENYPHEFIALNNLFIDAGEYGKVGKDKFRKFYNDFDFQTSVNLSRLYTPFSKFRVEFNECMPEVIASLESEPEPEPEPETVEPVTLVDFDEEWERCILEEMTIEELRAKRNQLLASLQKQDRADWRGLKEYPHFLLTREILAEKEDRTSNTGNTANEYKTRTDEQIRALQEEARLKQENIAKEAEERRRTLEREAELQIELEEAKRRAKREEAEREQQRIEEENKRYPWKSLGMEFTQWQSYIRAEEENRNRQELVQQKYFQQRLALEDSARKDAEFEQWKRVRVPVLVMGHRFQVPINMLKIATVPAVAMLFLVGKFLNAAVNYVPTVEPLTPVVNGVITEEYGIPREYCKTPLWEQLIRNNDLLPPHHPESWRVCNSELKMW